MHHDIAKQRTRSFELGTVRTVRPSWISRRHTNVRYVRVQDQQVLSHCCIQPLIRLDGIADFRRGVVPKSTKPVPSSELQPRRNGTWTDRPVFNCDAAAATIKSPSITGPYAAPDVSAESITSFIFAVGIARRHVKRSVAFEQPVAEDILAMAGSQSSTVGYGFADSAIAPENNLSSQPSYANSCTPTDVPTDRSP